VMDIARRRGDDVEVVEQPLGRRRRRVLTCILGEHRVDLAEGIHMFGEAAQMLTTAAAASRNNRQQRGQSSGVFVEQLDTEQLVGAERERPFVFSAHAGSSLRSLLPSDMDVRRCPTIVSTRSRRRQERSLPQRCRRNVEAPRRINRVTSSRC